MYRQQKPEVARIYPLEFIEPLRRAGEYGDTATIDKLTDEMARRGLVRQRADDSRAQEWDKLRAAASWGLRS